MVGGTIPGNINNLQFLERLRLQSTRFSGVIPSEVYSIRTIREINLRDAQFSGGIDASVVNATFLQIYDIGINANIRGELPDVFGKLSILGKNPLRRSFLNFALFLRRGPYPYQNYRGTQA